MNHLARVAFATLMLWMSEPSFGEAAPDTATVKLAKSYYDKGNAAYNLGRFEEAVGWFIKAYETWTVPDFLYNIAQSYRQVGNCKQALFAYKRYLSLKDKDKDTPLTRKERADIERFIKDLAVCVANADSSAAAAPDALKTTPISPVAPPPPTALPPSPVAPPPPTTLPPSPVAPPLAATPTTPPIAMTPTAASSNTPRLPPTTATVTEKPEVKALASKSPTEPRKLLFAYATGGIAIIGTGGSLEVPVQPSFAVGGGYLLSAGPVTLDLGARASFSPIHYDTMDATKRAALLGVRATVGATYPLNEKISVRGDLGLGFAMLRGLAEGHPFTDSGDPGSFTMLSFQIGVAGEYAITPNLSATIAPLGLAVTPVPDALLIGTLMQFDVLFGVSYRI